MGETYRFNLKFSPASPRDKQLYEWIRADTVGRQVNISGVIKELLYAWYLLRWRLGRLPVSVVVDIDEAPPPLAGGGNGRRLSLPSGNEEDPEDPLVRRLAGIDFSFDDM